MTQSKSIIGFSPYLGYPVGGAEKSTMAILQNLFNQGYDVETLSFQNPVWNGKPLRKMELAWSSAEISGMYQFSKFKFLEYCLNRHRVMQFFNNLNTESKALYTYGFYAPIAILSFKGSTRFYIRNEYDLGIQNNYFQGWKRVAKTLYSCSESYFYSIYIRDLRKSLQSSQVIANSKYMAERCLSLFNVRAEVDYPKIDELELKKQFNAKNGIVSQKGIVFVGDSLLKGLHIVVSLSKRFPNWNFYIFSQKILSPKREKNIQWLPWQKNSSDVFSYAELVIMPSIWEEAYGRIAREAKILGIPTLVSNHGGLPEAVDYCRESLVDDYKNVDAWSSRLRQRLS